MSRCGGCSSCPASIFWYVGMQRLDDGCLARLRRVAKPLMSSGPMKDRVGRDAWVGRGYMSFGGGSYSMLTNGYEEFLHELMPLMAFTQPPSHVSLLSGLALPTTFQQLFTITVPPPPEPPTSLDPTPAPTLGEVLFNSRNIFDCFRHMFLVELPPPHSTEFLPVLLFWLNLCRQLRPFQCNILRSRQSTLEVDRKKSYLCGLNLGSRVMDNVRLVQSERKSHFGHEPLPTFSCSFGTSAASVVNLIIDNNTTTILCCH